MNQLKGMFQEVKDKLDPNKELLFQASEGGRNCQSEAQKKPAQSNNLPHKSNFLR